MKHNAVPIILIVLLFLFLNPLNIFMPSKFVMMLIVFLIAVFGVFTAMVWKERPKDEREGFHRLYAGRLAFLVGSTILVIGIIVQELGHSSDAWLIYALLGMLLAKIFGFFYGQKKY